MSSLTLSPEDRALALQVLDEMRRSFRADIREDSFLRTVGYYLQHPDREPKAEVEQDVWQAFCRAKESR